MNKGIFLKPIVAPIKEESKDEASSSEEKNLKKRQDDKDETKPNII